jgi:hypothetical protein
LFTNNIRYTKIINELGVSAIGTDVDEHTKIAKEKKGLLKPKIQLLD